jgi:hypothetical protein
MKEIIKEQINQKLTENYILDQLPQELRDVFDLYIEKELSKNTNGETLQSKIVAFAYTYVLNNARNTISRDPIEEYSVIWINKFKAEALNTERPELEITVSSKVTGRQKRKSLGNDFDISSIDRAIKENISRRERLKERVGIHVNNANEYFILNLLNKLEKFEHLADEHLKYVVDNVVKRIGKRDLGRICSDLVIMCYAAKETAKMNPKDYPAEAISLYKQKIVEKQDLQNPANRCSLDNFAPMHERVDKFLADIQEYREELKAQYKPRQLDNNVIQLSRKQPILETIKDDALNCAQNRLSLDDNNPSLTTGKLKGILKKKDHNQGRN